MSFDGFRDRTGWLWRRDESADDVHHNVSNVLAAAGDDFQFYDTSWGDIAHDDITRDDIFRDNASGNDVHCGDRYNASALGVYRSIDTWNVDDRADAFFGRRSQRCRNRPRDDRSVGRLPARYRVAGAGRSP